MKFSTMRRLVLLACAIPLLAQAAGTAVYRATADLDMLEGLGDEAVASMEQEQASEITVRWLDPDTVHMTYGIPEGEDGYGYSVVREGKLYSVMRMDGQWMVLEAGEMVEGLAAMVLEDMPELQVRSAKIDKAGGSETVAGIRGDLYRLTVVDGNGDTETSELVLTSDSLVTELTQIANSWDQGGVAGARSEKLMAAMPRGKRGMLRWGDQFELVSISTEAPDAGLFELPAKPQSMAEMMQQMME